MQVRSKAGRAGICNSGLPAETEPIAGTQDRPAPALLSCGAAWEFASRDCQEVGPLAVLQKRVPSNKLEFPVSSSPFYYFP